MGDWDVVSTQKLDPWAVISSTPMSEAEPLPEEVMRAPTPEEERQLWSTTRKIVDPMLTSLPAAGATVGAVAGAPFIPTGPWGPAVPVATAAGGGAIGKSAENIVRSATGWDAPTPQEALTEPFKSGAEMGAFEMVGGGLGGLFKLRRAAKQAKSDPLIDRAMDVAKKEGLKLSPATVQPGSKMAQFKEWAGNFIPTGRMYTKYQQNKVYRWMMDSRARFLEETTGVPMANTGTFGRAAGEAGAAAKQEGSKAYQDIIKAAGGNDTAIPMTNLKQYFDSIYDDAPVKLQQVIKDFRVRVGQGETMTAKNLDEFVAKLSKVKEYKRQIDHNLFSDLEAFDKASGQQVKDAVASAAGKFKQAKGYEFLNGLFSKTTAERGGEEFFQTGNFYRMVMEPKNQKIMKEHFGEQALRNLKDYAELMLVMGREAEKRNRGNEVAELAKMALIGGGSFVNPTVALSYGFGPVAAWYIMKPRKEFLQWIAQSGMTKDALKIGGRAAISRGDEKAGEW